MLRRLAAAVLVTAAAGVVPALGAAPASAASCASAHGVTVVVEFNQLGGGTDVSCDTGGAGDVASQQFVDEGHPLTYASRQPGFVCRVDAVPASDPCVNTSPEDAYWGLWWSDGTSGTWTYSSLGADSLTVPDGGYVAFAWHQGSGTTTPQTAAPAHATSTPSPTHSPTHGPTHTATSAPPTAHPTATHTAQPTVAPTPTGATPSLTPTPSGATSATAAATGSASPTTTSPSTASAGGGDPTTSSGPPGPAVTRTPIVSPVHPLPSPTASSTGSASPTSSPGARPATGPGSFGGSGGLPAWAAPVVIVVLFGISGGFALLRRRRS